MSGYSSRVVSVNGSVIEFDCGAKHSHTMAESVSEGDFVMIDSHGRIWVKK